MKTVDGIEAINVTLVTEPIVFEDHPLGDSSETRVRELDGVYEDVSEFADRVFSYFGYGKEIRFRHVVDNYGNFYLHLYLNDELVKPNKNEIENYYNRVSTLNSGHISAKIIGDFGQDVIDF